MLLMMLIMSLPLLGVGLFFVLPFAAALPSYLVLVGFSALYQWLMMGAMRLPARTGREKMPGSFAVVRNWAGNSGQVVHDGEVWLAQTKEKQSFARGEKVAVIRTSGLKLWVSPVLGSGKGIKSSGSKPLTAVYRQRAQTQ